MAIVPAYPFNLLNGTIADATQVMADFDSVKNAVNSGAAANGANSDITSLTGLTTPLSIAQGGTGTATPGSGVAGTVGGYRNILRRNGGLEVWQRGAGGAALITVLASSSAYTADGWYLSAGASQVSTVLQAPGIVNGSRWAAKVQRSGGQSGLGNMTFGFPLDAAELYQAIGQYVRLSLTLQAAPNWSPASGNVRIIVGTGTGNPVKYVTGYTGVVNVIDVNQAITATPTRYQFNSAAVVPISTRQMEVLVAWTPTGTAGAEDGFFIDDVQLEVMPAATGYVSSNFERLLFTEQLLLCQPHFWKTFPYNVAPAQAAGGVGFAFSQTNTAQSAGYSIPHPGPMRGPPTVIGYNAVTASNQVRCDSNSADCTATSIVSSTFSIIVGMTAAAGSLAGYQNSIHLTADSGI